jgi:hypothetical protein
MTSATGIKLAEVGFLLVAIAGVWLVAAEIPALGMKRLRTIVAGTALVAAGVVLIIASHWGISAKCHRRREGSSAADPSPSTCPRPQCR